MVMKSTAQSIFLLVVAEGAALAQGPLPSETEETAICHMELKEKKYFEDTDLVEFTKTTCLDEKTTNEIIAIIEEAREQAEEENPEEDCLTPFCGCWLG